MIPIYKKTIGKSMDVPMDSPNSHSKDKKISGYFTINLPLAFLIFTYKDKFFFPLFFSFFIP